MLEGWRRSSGAEGGKGLFVSAAVWRLASSVLRPEERSGNVEGGVRMLMG